MFYYMPYDNTQQKTIHIVRERLHALREPAYQAFVARLVPNIPAENIWGVRAPALCKLARQLEQEGLAEHFLRALPHTYLEENNLHAYLLQNEKDAQKTLAGVLTFLPYIDNWATCDIGTPRIFHKNPALLLYHVPAWLDYPHAYTQRYAIGVLMQHYLGTRFEKKFLDMVGLHKSDHYYVNMMRAWYFSMALVHQWQASIPWVEGKRLDTWTHRKTIQKAIESHQISLERKAYLKTLR